MARIVKFKVNKTEYEMVNNWKPVYQQSILTEEQQDAIFISENKKLVKRYNQKLASEKRKKTMQYNKEKKKLYEYYNLVKKKKGFFPSFHDEILLPELEKNIKRLEAEEQEKKNKK